MKNLIKRLEVKPFSERGLRGVASLQESKSRDLDHFRYASVDITSKHRCRVCGAPVRRRSIRRVVLCPVCGQELEGL